MIYCMKASSPAALTTQLKMLLLQEHEQISNVCNAYIVNRLLLEGGCGKTTCSVFVDLSKAIDWVKHQNLLSGIGSSGVVLKWFTNYLLDRQQRVRVGNRVSRQSPCSWGIPQGSVLGSLRFMLYMQNVPTWVNAKVLMFANDILLFPGGFSIPETACGLTNVVTSLDSWITISGLQMNTAKHRQLLMFVLLRGVKCPPDTVVLCISRSLQLVTSYKYLGVILDHRLNWETQILNITQKVFQKIGDLLHAGHQLTLSAKRKFFVSVIAADLGYFFFFFTNKPKLHHEE